MLRLNLKLTTVTGRRTTAWLQLSFILLVLQVCSGRPGRTSCYAMRLNSLKVWPVSCVISLRDDAHHTWRHHKLRQLPGVTGLAAWQLASCTLSVCMLLAGRRQREGRLYQAWDWRRVKVTTIMLNNNYRFFLISEPVIGCKTGNRQTGNSLITLVSSAYCI